jgi:hypothetical protein
MDVNRTTETRAPGRKALSCRGVATMLALAALALCADSASAATKDFSLKVAPGTVPAGRLVDMTATLTNLTSQQRLGSANITPAGGLTAEGFTPLPSPATVAIVANVVQVRNLSLAPGASVTVSLTVRTPCSTGQLVPDWSVVAKQANDFSGLPGNDLALDLTASSLTTTTTGVCAPCPENQRCDTGIGGPTGSSSAVTANPSATQTDTGVLTDLNVEPLVCAGFTQRSTDTFRIEGPPNRPKFGSIRYAASTAAVTSKYPLDVCYGAPSSEPFALKPKTLANHMIIEGVDYLVGRLPNCLGFSPPPCVTGRDNATKTISFSMPAGDPRNM